MEFYKAARRSKEDTIKRFNDFKESEEYKSMSAEDKEVFDNALKNLQTSVNITDLISNSALANGAMSKYPKQPKEPKAPDFEGMDKKVEEAIKENKDERNGDSN